MNKIFLLIKAIFSKILKHTTRFLHKFSAINLNECRNNKITLQKERSRFPKIYNKKTPLVSVLIATYNRGEILTQRTLPSILNQTYQNFEIIVVGDQCTDNTEDLLKNFNDPRVKFYNLSKRGDYPSNRYNRWLVAGVTPRNKSIELSSGDWITHIDDDDEFTENHIETLLIHALKHSSELVYGKFLMEIKPNKWATIGSYPPKCGAISHISILYAKTLKFINYDINAWKYKEPADWNMLRRMKEAKVKISFVDSIVGKHYLEGTKINRKPF